MHANDPLFGELVECDAASGVQPIELTPSLTSLDSTDAELPVDVHSLSIIPPRQTFMIPVDVTYLGRGAPLPYPDPLADADVEGD